MMKTMGKWGMCAALMMLAGPGILRAQSTPATPAQQNEQPPKPVAGSSIGAGSSSVTTIPAKPDPAEDAAFQNFISLSPEAPNQQVQQGEAFLQKYPQSRYNSVVYSRLTEAYYNKQDMDKMFAAGDKALALNPDEYTVMILIGWVTPHNYDPNATDAQVRLDKAERYCKRGDELLQTIQKPANLTDQQFETARNETLSQGHSCLGIIYFREKKFPEATAELQLAVKVGPKPNPTDYFVLGMSLGQQQKFTESAAAFDQCGALSSALHQHCVEEGSLMRKRASAAGGATAAPAATPGAPASSKP
jgi:tetratricopeptide (TPR) repeat protein